MGTLGHHGIGLDGQQRHTERSTGTETDRGGDENVGTDEAFGRLFE